MGKITFIIGGGRSGKSRYAASLLKTESPKRIAFIATCQGLDSEMRTRVALHKKARPANWQTFEEPRRVSLLLEKIGGEFDWILMDCLTLLVSNLMLKNFKEKHIEDEMRKVLSILKKIKARSIIVSNEVGLGIVPNNRMARDFRDIAGRVNQLVAERSDRVFFMVSGIPWRIK